MTEPSNPSNLDQLTASLNKIGDGISDAARDLNPIHPQTSIQASLLLAAVFVGIGAYLYAKAITLTQQAYTFFFLGIPT